MSVSTTLIYFIYGPGIAILSKSIYPLTKYNN